MTKSRFPLPERKKWTGNPDSHRFDNCDEECLVCGRPIVGANSPVVWMTTKNEFVPYDEDRSLEKQWTDMGAYFVGTGCAKHIPSRFLMYPKKGSGK